MATKKQIAKGKIAGKKIAITTKTTAQFVKENPNLSALDKALISNVDGLLVFVDND